MVPDDLQAHAYLPFPTVFLCSVWPSAFETNLGAPTISNPANFLDSQRAEMLDHPLDDRVNRVRLAVRKPDPEISPATVFLKCDGIALKQIRNHGQSTVGGKII